MKRTGFANKPRKPLKRSPFKRSTTLKKKSVGKQNGKRLIYGAKIWSLKVADNKFSLWIREQRGYKCENCGIYHEPPTRYIQCSHYIGRKHMATRFDPDNCDVLCSTCHAKWEDRKQYEYRDWKIAKMGQEKHDALKLKQSTTFGQKDAIYNCMVLLGAI